MSRPRQTDEQRIDAYISTAPRDALVRLQSEVNAALKYRVFTDTMRAIDEIAPRTRRKAEAQLPLAAKVE